ncbi:MAG TPA: helix-turn-helix transcriptional regulator [Mucilaginibacter sp.]|jgi:transcriptional regulator with XRE-family HTH domain
MRSVNDFKIKGIISNIRNIRESKGYSQFYLATKLGISQNAYSKIELGYSSITVDRLLKIADILDTDIIDLLNYKSDKPVRLKVLD